MLAQILQPLVSFLAHLVHERQKKEEQDKRREVFRLASCTADEKFNDDDTEYAENPPDPTAASASPGHAFAPRQNRRLRECAAFRRRYATHFILSLLRFLAQSCRNKSVSPMLRIIK